MQRKTTVEHHYRGPGWAKFVINAIGGLATILALVLLYLDVTGRIPEARRVQYVLVDTLLCVVFAAEFGIMLWLAEDRWGHVRHRWPDLLASIPMIHELRAFRALRGMRLLRAFRVAGLLLRAFGQFEDVLKVPLMRSALVVAAVAIIVGSLAIADIERDNETLNSLEKGLWWSVVTMTTVGYGDAYPRTGLGKIIAACLMIVGVGLFGAVAGTFASLILRTDRDTAPLERRVADLEAKCAKLETKQDTAPDGPGTER